MLLRRVWGACDWKHRYEMQPREGWIGHRISEMHGVGADVEGMRAARQSLWPSVLRLRMKPDVPLYLVEIRVLGYQRRTPRSLALGSNENLGVEAYIDRELRGPQATTTFVRETRGSSESSQWQA